MTNDNQPMVQNSTYLSTGMCVDELGLDLHFTFKVRCHHSKEHLADIVGF
jgi:hypothetical protein